MKHKHHIIPKHEGGTDNPENIVYLSVSEHAEAHKELYEKNGKITTLSNKVLKSRRQLVF